MIVLSHRGYWRDASEKNSLAAFERSFDLGFGTETDIRDRDGRLVISHDPPGPGALALETVLGLLKDRPLPLAINIKADGLSRLLAACIAAELPGLDFFAFDMSVPDMRHCLAAGLPVFGRMSEEEAHIPWGDRCAGVWLDAFQSTWWGEREVRALLDAGKRVCVVSPELHRREHLGAWRSLQPLAGHPGLMICTDLPEEARVFFGAPA